MPLLINQKLVENDPWQPVDAEQPLPTEGQLIIPLARLVEEKEQLSGQQVAVLINGDDDFNLVLEMLDTLKAVVVEIPAFTDGRGFSFARILRRKGFEGQIRAIGDVTRDRLEFLERCGFDAFDIPADRYSDDINTAFGEMGVTYQGSSDDPRPIFRR